MNIQFDFGYGLICAGVVFLALMVFLVLAWVMSVKEANEQAQNSKPMDYTEAMNHLEDNWTSLSNEIGGELIPVLTTAVNSINELMQAEEIRPAKQQLVPRKVIEVVVIQGSSQGMASRPTNPRRRR